jgi:hypothetical protein
MSSAHTKQEIVMSTITATQILAAAPLANGEREEQEQETRGAKTYGIATGEGADTEIIELEADTLDGAREEAAKLMQREIRPSSLVELDGRGPFYSSDGELIANTHAPSRTIEDHIEANYWRLMPAAWPRQKGAYDALRSFEAGAAFVLDRSTEGKRGPEVEQTYLCDVDFRKVDDQGLVQGEANGVRVYSDESCWVYNNGEDEVGDDLTDWLMSWCDLGQAERIAYEGADYTDGDEQECAAERQAVQILKAVREARAAKEKAK